MEDCSGVFLYAVEVYHPGERPRGGIGRHAAFRTLCS